MKTTPYYKAAPGWTTLTGGTYPKHAYTPTQICEWLADVAVCVPFIKRVQYAFLESDGRTVLGNLDDIRAGFFFLQNITSLYFKHLKNKEPNYS